MNIKNIPVLEILSVSLITSFLFTLIQLWLSGKLGSVSTTPSMILVGTFAVSITSAMYISAFKYAPPVHVELVMFVWPILVILGNIIFHNEKISYSKFFAVALCFSAFILLHFENLINNEISFSFYFGYLLTLCAALTWTIYNLFARSSKNCSSELMGVYAGLGACVILPAHFIFESTVFPNNTQLLLLVIMGLFSQSLAYQTWDYAVKNISPVTMTNIAYCTPILSVILLLSFGFGVMTNNLLYSCLLMLAASILIMPRNLEN